MTVDLTKLPSSVCALYFIATVASEGRSFADVKSAKMRLVDWTSGEEMCRYYPAMSGAHTALFMCRIARASPQAAWKMSTIGDVDHTARDWGTLVPEVAEQGLQPRLQPACNRLATRLPPACHPLATQPSLPT